MIDCESLRERMPLVAHGRATWTEPDRAHLEACADCAAEWRMIQTATRLGDAAARRVDPARIGTAVLGRLSAERGARRWKRGGWLAGLAAAAVVALMLRSGDQRGSLKGEAGRPAPASAPLRVPLAELENLDTAELESVLDGLDAPLGEQAAPDAPHLGDLNDSQLERVLRSLEG